MQSTKEITLFIALTVLAILFFIVLVAFIILWSKRKILEKENNLQEAEKKNQVLLIKTIVETEEAQKTKIASDLHDQIIPLITLSALNLSTKVNELEENGLDFSGVKKEIENIANLANNIREIAHGIIPNNFQSLGLIESIEAVVEQMNNVNGCQAIFKKSKSLTKILTLSVNQQLTIYRICLELLNNLLKHANYRHLSVILEGDTNIFILVFTHDGIGMTNKKIRKLTEGSNGIGLKSLESRALSLGATIDYIEEKGVSYIYLKVPLNK